MLSGPVFVYRLEDARPRLGHIIRALFTSRESWRLVARPRNGAGERRRPESCGGKRTRIFSSVASTAAGESCASQPARPAAAGNPLLHHDRARLPLARRPSPLAPPGALVFRTGAAVYQRVRNYSGRTLSRFEVWPVPYLTPLRARICVARARAPHVCRGRAAAKPRRDARTRSAPRVRVVALDSRSRRPATTRALLFLSVSLSLSIGRDCRSKSAGIDITSG